MQAELLPFSRRLLKERQRLHITQAKAAEICGVTREMWSKYERAEVGMRIDVLARFASAGADICEIIVGENALRPLVSYETELLEAYENATAQTRLVVSHIMDLDAKTRKVEGKLPASYVKSWRKWLSEIDSDAQFFSDCVKTRAEQTERDAR